MIGEVIAVFTAWGARLRRDLDSGTRVGEISAQIHGFAESVGCAERQAVRQSLFDAGLGGIVVADAVALHHINRAVALIGTTRIECGDGGWNARHDHGPVVDSLGQ